MRETLGSFGFGSHADGGFTEALSIATDQQGNIYAGEAWEGKRAERFLLQTAPARKLPGVNGSPGPGL